MACPHFWVGILDSRDSRLAVKGGLLESFARFLPAQRGRVGSSNGANPCDRAEIVEGLATPTRGSLANVAARVSRRRVPTAFFNEPPREDCDAAGESHCDHLSSGE